MIAAGLERKRRAGGGKSGLRRAVCRITSGMCASRHIDGQCNREYTAFVGSVARERDRCKPPEVRVKRCGKSAPGGQ
jgi:hypothetical protein